MKRTRRTPHPRLLHAGSPDALLAALAAAEVEVRRTVRQLDRLRHPVRRLECLWRLGWLKLRQLEDFRPAGGFRQ